MPVEKARGAPIRLILASASPRRYQLLAQLGLEFEIQPADVDESIQPGESPAAYVERVAKLKASEVARRAPDAVALGADTVVVIGGEILGKPRTAEVATQMLTRLSGCAHLVLTGVALAGAHRASQLVQTKVDFRALSPREINWYVRTGEPMDKAGGYAAQGVGGFLVQAVHGSYSNVVGLPLAETLALLAQAGVGLPWGKS
jgi:septum formation protein